MLWRFWKGGTVARKGRKTCLFESCERLNFAHGYCSSHAAQIRRGVPLRAIRAPKPDAAEGFAYCSTCKQFQDEEYFSPDRTRGGLQRVCRPCKATAMVEYNAHNRDRVRRQATLNRWGITAEHYDAMLTSQGGCCAMCGKEPRAAKVLCVDHDHVTGAVRGLLCQDCNLGIGQLQEDPELLEAGATYLRVGGVLPPELAFTVDVETHGKPRTDIRRRARLDRDASREKVNTHV